MRIHREIGLWMWAVINAWYGWVGASATAGMIGFGQGMKWWDVPSRQIYIAIIVVGFVISVFQAWVREHRHADVLAQAVKELTWPADRPMLAFNHWGERGGNFIPDTELSAMRERPQDRSPLLLEYGFYLNNDGGAALEIAVDNFQIGQMIAVGGTLVRIEKNSRGFVPVWIKDASHVVKWNLDMALEAAWKLQVKEVEDVWLDKPIEIPVSVVYRDYNNLWYRSHSILCFTADPLYPNHITFTAPTQERLGLTRPESTLYIRGSLSE